ncbi:MAG: hypothetical protein H0Z39_00540 [Peptococcaceae bacterium]|nr:hypothetical protein [Peptococcaceae bacterium]
MGTPNRTGTLFLPVPGDNEVSGKRVHGESGCRKHFLASQIVNANSTVLFSLPVSERQGDNKRKGCFAHSGATGNIRDKPGGMTYRVVLVRGLPGAASGRHVP